MKMTDYSYNAGELGNKAVERFVAVDDPYTKEFSNIFSFYKQMLEMKAKKLLICWQWTLL